MQDIAWILTLVVMGALAAIFVWVFASASRSGSVGRSAEVAYRWRTWLFWLAIAAGVLVTVTTLREWPIGAHAAGATRPDRVIRVTGHQWRWELSEQSARVGELVEFQVTSADVNHGFAVYQGRTRVLAQTQAMPGYTNHLRVRFDTPGDYQVLCLEYCGLVHHGMLAAISVR
jgi:cytochrome c oxidase subunit II